MALSTTFTQCAPETTEFGKIAQNKGHGTQKYDRGLSRLVHTELHWLDVSERVKYKRHGAQLFVPDRLLPPTLRSNASAASQIRKPTTSERTTLPAEFFCPTSFLCGRPEYLRDTAVGRDSFRKQLKTFLFATY